MYLGCSDAPPFQFSRGNDALIKIPQALKHVFVETWWWRCQWSLRWGFQDHRPIGSREQKFTPRELTITYPSKQESRKKHRLKQSHSIFWGIWNSSQGTWIGKVPFGAKGQESSFPLPCVPWSKVAILGMVIAPLIGILIMGPYQPLRTWVEFPIPYYMEMSWELIDPIAHVSFVGVKPVESPLWEISPPGGPGTGLIFKTPRHLCVCVCVRVFVETVQLKDQDLNSRISRWNFNYTFHTKYAQSKRSCFKQEWSQLWSHVTKYPGMYIYIFIYIYIHEYI